MNNLWTQLIMRYASSAAELRRVPVLGSLIRWTGEKLVPRDSRVWVQVQGGPAEGLWLCLHPRTGGPYLRGGGEPEVQAAIQRHLRAGMTFYDIGANIGFYSLLAARIVGPQGVVVAFEPEPEVAQRLREHVERNHFSNISVEQKAVWSETGTVCFERADPQVSPDCGLGHVVRNGALGMNHLHAVSLDGFVQTNSPPGFLKCDVEGAEVEVFRGAGRLLRENRPILLCEMHSEENRRILVEEFASLGYRCEVLDDTHVLALPK